MPRVGFEPTISAGERPKTYALDRAATGTGVYNPCYIQFPFNREVCELMSLEAWCDVITQKTVL